MDPAQKPPQPVSPNPAPMASTEISLDEAKKLEHSGGGTPAKSGLSSGRKKKFIILGIVALIVLLIGGIILFLASRPKPAPKPVPKVTPTPTKAVSTILPIMSGKKEKILFPYVPHFSDLKYSDLPNVYDIRGIFNYKKNLIIVSTSGIYEFDPETDEFIRQSDPRVFGCINYATIIGTMLYISCNGEGNLSTQEKGIYVINLDTGELEKVYTEGSAKLSYATVANIGEILWVGARNEVVKVNTKTDAMQEYSPQELGLPNCEYFMVHAYNNVVWATCVSPTVAAVSIYDQSSNSWKPVSPAEDTTDPIYTFAYNTKKLYFLSFTQNPTLYTYDIAAKTLEATAAGSLQIPSSKPLAQEIRTQLGNDLIFPGVEQKGISYLSYYDVPQKKVIDFELLPSDYIGMSDIINQKRYLFTRNAVDTVKEKGFPQSLRKLTTSVGLGTKIYIDPFENYAVLIGSASASTPPFTADLIELKKGTVTNLLQNNKSLEEISPEVFDKFVRGLPKNRLFGTKEGAEMTDIATGRTILEINFPEKSLRFYEY